MVLVIKDICIFTIAAQALLLMVPGNSYMKYVKVLVGMIMVLLICNPLVSWLSGKEGPYMEQVLWELEEGMPRLQKQEGKESFMGIYSSIEEEIKYKLNQELAGRYLVKTVELKWQERESDKGGESVIQSIWIDVEETKENSHAAGIAPVKISSREETEQETEALEQKIGECIGVAPERLKVSISYG